MVLMGLEKQCLEMSFLTFSNPLKGKSFVLQWILFITHDLYDTSEGHLRQKASFETPTTMRHLLLIFCVLLAVMEVAVFIAARSTIEPMQQSLQPKNMLSQVLF